MKTAIYQCWSGNLRSGALYSKKLMNKYAAQVDADYIFERDPQWAHTHTKFDIYYDRFKVIYDPQFDSYDMILYADMDIYPQENVGENIFEEFKKTNSDFGICEELFQPEQRARLKKNICKENDEKWASVIEKWKGIKLPRTENNLLKVYNAGLFIMTAEGRRKAQKYFDPFLDYIKLCRKNNLYIYYHSDQCYIHSMLCAYKNKLKYAEIDPKWNRFIHYYYKDEEKKILDLFDGRFNNETNFVHLQMKGADDMEDFQIKEIVNAPRMDWKHKYVSG